MTPSFELTESQGYVLNVFERERAIRRLENLFN